MMGNLTSYQLSQTHRVTTKPSKRVFKYLEIFVLLYLVLFCHMNTSFTKWQCPAKGSADERQGGQMPDCPV